MWKCETMLKMLDKTKFHGTGHFNDNTLTISQTNDEAPMTNNEFRCILRQIYHRNEENKIHTLISPFMGLTNGYWELCGFRNLRHIDMNDNDLVTFLIPNQVVHLNVANNPRLKLVREVQDVIEENGEKNEYDPDFIFNINDFSQIQYFTSDLDDAEEYALQNDQGPFHLKYLNVTGSNSKCLISLFPWNNYTFAWLNRKGFDFFNKTFPNLFVGGQIEEDIGLAEIFMPFLQSKKPRC